MTETADDATFAAEGTFAALHDAERFLRAAGFSTGSLQRGAPIAVMFGDYAVSKWRGLSSAERKASHGILYTDSGSFREGPVRLRLTKNCPAEGREAIAAALRSAAPNVE